MGTHEILYEGFLKPLLAGHRPERGAPAGKLLFVDEGSSPALRRKYPESKGTANFLRMGRTAALLHAVQFGTPADVAASLELVQDMLSREHENGLWLREQTPCDPHFLYHIAAEVALRKAVLIATRATPPPAWAIELNAESVRRIVGLRNLYQLVATPDGEVLGPCTRAGASRRNILTPPFTQVGTGFYRLVSRLPQLGPSKDQDWWKDETYGLPLSYLREMLFTDAAGALKGRAPMDGPDHQLAAALKEPGGSVPHLRLPMHVMRSDKGHVAWLDGHKELEPIVSWVRVDYGPPRHHQITFGHNWTSQPERDRLGNSHENRTP
jgi:hypothetical protein